MEATNGTSSPAAPQAAGRTGAAGTFNMNRVSLGYGIAIAVGMMVLICTMMLVCVRLHMGRGSVAQAAAARRRRRRLAAQSRPGAEPDPHAVVHVAGADWPSVEGLDEETLQSYPKIMYAVDVDGADAPPALPPGVKDGSCSICLGDYSDGETLRLLPDCGHVFHAHCIDAWLRLHASCPMCRSSPLPTPVSTPLSELIPLARNPLQHHHQNLPR